MIIYGRSEPKAIKRRQRHADANYERKHPILLSAKHPIVMK